MEQNTAVPTPATNAKEKEQSTTTTIVSPIADNSKTVFPMEQERCQASKDSSRPAGSKASMLH